MRLCRKRSPPPTRRKICLSLPHSRESAGRGGRLPIRERMRWANFCSTRKVLWSTSATATRTPGRHLPGQGAASSLPQRRGSFDRSRGPIAAPDPGRAIVSGALRLLHGLQDLGVLGLEGAVFRYVLQRVFPEEDQGLPDGVDLLDGVSELLHQVLLDV